MQRAAGHFVPTDEDQAATPLELFFDLVFVFALTQVTTFMAHDLGWLGLFQGLLILSLFWWGWVGIAWLSNLIRLDEGPVRLVLLAAMGVMFLVALAIPQAFHAAPGAISGPYLIAGAYLAFRLTHLVLFWDYSRGDAGLRRQLIRFCPTLVVSAACLVLAAGSHDARTQTAWWAAALVADYLGTILGGARGWRLRSASHFAERHGLIVIIALGETIVAIGVGATDLPLTWPLVVAGLSGIAIAAALWWIYFDITAIKGQEALADMLRGGGSVAMARDAYSILHLPLMAGIVLIALGLKKTMEYVGDSSAHGLSDPLGSVPAAALCGGVMLYLLGHVGFKLRIMHEVGTSRAALAGVIAAIWTFSSQFSALMLVVSVAALLWFLVVFETFRYAEERSNVRSAG